MANNDKDSLKLIDVSDKLKENEIYSGTLQQIDHKNNDKKIQVASGSGNNIGSESVKSVEDKKSTSRLKKWQKRMRFQPKNVTLDSEEKHKYYKELVPELNEENFEIPRAVPVAEYVEEAEKEIKAMMTAIKQHSGSKTALQILPKHLRRRSASHNIKRLPTRLRELASQQMAQSKALGGQDKKVCRRKRRRKVDLQNEYAERAEKQGWLETHLWHAKRFKMSQQTDLHFADWKKRVAILPSDKSFRACYRAVAKHCLIELKGQETHIKLLLGDILEDHDMCKVSDTSDANGKLAIEVMMCKKANGSVIGPVQVLWKPNEEQEKDGVTALWCWVHPAAFTQSLELLQNFTFEHGITISDKSKDLVRFRLTGPKSSVTLLSVLNPMKLLEDRSQTAEHLSKQLLSWTEEHDCQIKKSRDTLFKILSGYHRSHFQSTYQDMFTGVRHGEVLSFVCDDPRLTLPLQKTIPTFKATVASSASDIESVATDEKYFHTREELTPWSPLWDSGILDEIAASRLPDHVTSTRKNDAKFSLGEEKTKHLASLSTPVPVLFIRRNGFVPEHVKQTTGPHAGPSSGFGSGWDLVLPKKWATAFWIPLIYHRARAGGLREREHCHLECKVPFFPRDFPETDAGRKWWKAEAEMNRKTYYGKPPSKRVNYSVLATPFPFAPDWQCLFLPMEGTKGNVPSVEIATVKKEHPSANNSSEGLLLSDNQNFAKVKGELIRKRKSEVVGDDVIPCKRIKGFDVTPFSVLRHPDKVAELREILNAGKCDGAIQFLESLPFHTLICVKVSMINRGIPSPQSMLCAPTCDDFNNLRREFEDLNGEGIKTCTGPVEPGHDDPYLDKRKLATAQAKKRRKRKAEAEHVTSSANRQPPTFEVMPSRQIIGFVTSGDFLFSYASGGGVGFVSAQHMVALLKSQLKNAWLCEEFAEQTKPPLVLLRTIDSTQYRFARLTVTC